MNPIKKAKSILVIDDDRRFLEFFEKYVKERYPSLHVITCSDPLKCLAFISADLDLMLVDLEMPGLDGAKVLSYAIAKGVHKNRIIVLSAHDSDYLHKRFAMGSCLAVLNKFEEKQRDVLDMVLTSLQNKQKK